MAILWWVLYDICLLSLIILYYWETLIKILQQKCLIFYFIYSVVVTYHLMKICFNLCVGNMFGQRHGKRSSMADCPMGCIMIETRAPYCLIWPKDICSNDSPFWLQKFVFSLWCYKILFSNFRIRNWMQCL